MAQSRFRDEDSFPWPEDAVALLRELAPTGASASEMAARIGHGVTRSAVLGKCSRLKIKLAGKRPKEILKRDQAAVQRRKATTSLVMLRPAPFQVAEEKAAEYHASPARKRAFDPACAPQGARLVPLTELRTAECKWPLFEGGPMLFCACAVSTRDRNGQPDIYCATHKAMSVSKASVSQQADER